MDYNVSSKKEARGVIVGMLLGDGGRSRRNFYIGHSSKQRDYALFKARLLETITRKPVNVREYRTKDGFDTIRVEPRICSLTRVMTKKAYPLGKRKVTKELLELLTPQGIAIWFMDDGSSSFKKRNGKIHAVETTLNTYCSEEENEIIVKYFKDLWGFQWGFNRSKGKIRLRMGTKEARRFFGFLEPYILDSMCYKLKVTLCEA
jgi:hypothetical protein